MGKNPAFQFYPSDWTRDLDDQDIEVEGAWIRIICRLWWSEKRGESTKPLREWARILRKTEQKTSKIFQILFEKGIASGDVLDNQNVTIISRRMVRDYEISQIRKAVGKLGGNPGLKKIQENLDNQNLSKTASLLLQSSTSKKNNHILKIIFEDGKFKTIPDALMEKWREVAPGINIPAELKKAELWLLANPEKRRSRWGSFLSTWMVRAQDNFIKYGGNHGGIRTTRSDPRDKNLQSREDAEVAAITARWEAAKKAAGDKTGGVSGNDDTPNFSG